MLIESEGEETSSEYTAGNSPIEEKMTECCHNDAILKGTYRVIRYQAACRPTGPDPVNMKDYFKSKKTRD